MIKNQAATVLEIISKEKEYKLEKEFEEKIRDILLLLGIKTIHVPESTKKNLSLPDLLCLPHKLDTEAPAAFFIEVKRNKDSKLSDIQKVTFSLLNDTKIKCYICSSWEDLKNIIKDLYKL